jgi:aminopeptidase N
VSKQTPRSSRPAIHLRDYRPPEYRIETADLHFDLDPARTRVQSRLRIARRPDAAGSAPLVLNGETLKLLDIRLDGRPLDARDYTLTETTLTLASPPEQFALDIETEIAPGENTALSGLYVSGGNFCTQCEPEGFRRITYFIDRPDVLVRFTATVAADRRQYPVLLSNGNRVADGELPGGRHFVTWHDPWPKPAYLFALVAGDLARVEDSFTTRGGRVAPLHMYVQAHNRDRCGHAMAALKKAMRWDEEVYGREYDLDVFMIVAVDDFNMGAMENKGLNIFNSKYVLAQPETATDGDYDAIESVIAHEYFHNWSGNRVTCRDWFQLSLKEGFTVFRDQEFSADQGSRGVRRIHDANIIRTHQFREDAGPMAHPVRPESYVEINNFYTTTVYNKGAEVVRMAYHLLGPEKFRRGTDLYFARHDGHAVTTDDFVQALEDASGEDLAQFRLWYAQAGTPELHVTREWRAAEKTLHLRVRQHCPPTPDGSGKQPFQIPLAIGLLGPDGKERPVRLAGEPAGMNGTRVLTLRGAEQTFALTGLDAPPVPSLLRGFSAPVRMVTDLTDAEQLFLLAHDTDPFNRWDAGQTIATRLILRIADGLRKDDAPDVPPATVDAFGKVLTADSADKAFLASVLTLPSESYLAGCVEEIEPELLHRARRHVRAALARALAGEFRAVYDRNYVAGPYRHDGESAGRRALRNLCLGYLTDAGASEGVAMAMAQFRSASNMTDTLAALSALAQTDTDERRAALTEFDSRWRDDPLVMDKWFSVQATSRRAQALDEVMALMQHPVFSIRNPNRVRALIGAFCHGNPARFHDPSGRGYAFIAEQVLVLDALNPQIAARIVGVFDDWRRFEPVRRARMQAQLERIAATAGLSPNVGEVVTKALAAQDRSA